MGPWAWEAGRGAEKMESEETPGEAVSLGLPGCRRLVSEGRKGVLL